MFQFYAGDLYDVIPKIRDLYFASDPVDGECEATHNGLQIYKNHIESFNVSIHYECMLKILNQKIASFSIGLQLEIEGKAKARSVDFRLKSHDESVHFDETPNFHIAHEDLAKNMIHHSVNRLYFENLFGSGWTLSPPRDYPHLICS